MRPGDQRPAFARNGRAGATLGAGRPRLARTWALFVSFCAASQADDVSRRTCATRRPRLWAQDYATTPTSTRRNLLKIRYHLAVDPDWWARTRSTRPIILAGERRRGRALATIIIIINLWPGRDARAGVRGPAWWPAGRPAAAGRVRGACAQTALGARRRWLICVRNLSPAVDRARARVIVPAFAHNSRRPLD